MGVAILIGVIGNAVSAAGKIELLGTSSEAETIIIRLSNIMGQNGVLLALLAGVIMAGILACTMSTADSQLLAAASSVSQNLLQDFAGIKMKEKDSHAHRKHADGFRYCSDQYPAGMESKQLGI